VNQLDQLESRSVHILREAYANFTQLCMLWSIGKDSTGTDWKTVGYWATLRASGKMPTDDGNNFLRISHPTPVGVKYWEIGNELYGNGYYHGNCGWEADKRVPYPDNMGTNCMGRKDNPVLSPSTYGMGVKQWAAAMKAVDPTIKNYHWIDLVLSLFDAYDRGADTSCVVDANGNVAEGPGFNVFMVKDGVVRTADRGVLEGISRKTVIELCGALAVPLKVGPVPAAELPQAAASARVAADAVAPRVPSVRAAQAVASSASRSVPSVRNWSR